MRFSKGFSIIAIAFMLAACGGGGGGSGSTPPTSAAAQKSGSVKITITIPAAKTQSARAIRYLEQQQSRKSVHREYISGGTTEIDFTLATVNGVAATSSEQSEYDFTVYTSGKGSNCAANANGGYTCTITEPAPVGNDTYVVAAQQCSIQAGATPCSSAGGTLTLLSQTYVPVNVVYDQTTVAAFTFSGVVASIAWAAVSYANISGPTALNSLLWLTQPNGPNSPVYTPADSSYSCSSNVGSGTANGCYEPVAQGTPVAYGEVLEAFDASGALILGATGGPVYQTPLYLDQNGNAITISWSCSDNSGTQAVRRSSVPPGDAYPDSLTWETGGGPYTSNTNTAPLANESFNSPVVNPANDPDGGNTVDGNGNPVTAVGNNGTEMNWDGVDQPSSSTPDSCTATTSNGLSTSANFYVGLGAGGVTFTSQPQLDATMYLGFPQVGGNPGTPAEISSFAAGQFANPASATMTLPYGGWPDMTIDSSGNLWVAETSGASNYILEYAPGSTTPERTISPPAFTGAWNNIAVSGTEVYVENEWDNLNATCPPCGEIDAYSTSANGASTPVASWTSSNFNLPNGNVIGPFTVDGNGNFWLFDTNTNAEGGWALSELPANATSTTTATTVLDSSWAAACNNGNAPNFYNFVFDTIGNMVAYDFNSQTVMIFPSGFNDSTCPSRFTPETASGGGLGNDIAVDNNGLIYLLAANNVYVYTENAANGPNGYAPPNYTFTNPGEGLPASIALSYPSGGGSGSVKRRSASHIVRIH